MPTFCIPLKLAKLEWFAAVSSVLFSTSRRLGFDFVPGKISLKQAYVSKQSRKRRTVGIGVGSFEMPLDDAYTTS